MWRSAIACIDSTAIALALIVELGCQVIERPEIQQVITKKIQLLDREGIDTIDHRISDGSNLQTQPTDNPRSLLILCLELFELGIVWLVVWAIVSRKIPSLRRLSAIAP